MAGNILQAIGLSPEWFQSVMGSVAHGTDQPETEAPQQMQPQQQPQQQNLLEGLNYDPAAAAMPQQQFPSQEEPAPPAPKTRRSLLDTVGGIADVFAKVGGAEALYQPSIDARQNRGFAQEDRARMVNLEKLKLDLASQQVQGGRRDVLGQTVRGLQAIQAGGGDVNKVWPVLAQRMGIDPEQAAQIGQEIANDPNAIVGLSAALNEPQSQGTQPKEIQIYGMLQEKDPALAAMYLQNLTNPDAMTEKQRADLTIAAANLGINREELVLKREDARSQIAARDAKASGGVADLTPTQRGQITQKLKILPSVERSLARVDQLSRQLQSAEGSAARGYVGGLVPGALVGGKADEFDKAVGLLRQQIVTLTRTPGIGSMSDYETRLLGEAIPSRRSSDEGRAETLSNLRALVSDLGTGYKEMIGPASGRPAVRRGILPPRANRQNVPATPKVGAVQGGYRFKGGNPASPASWDKVQ